MNKLDNFITRPIFEAHPKVKPLTLALIEAAKEEGATEEDLRIAFGIIEERAKKKASDIPVSELFEAETGQASEAEREIIDRFLRNAALWVLPEESESIHDLASVKSVAEYEAYRKGKKVEASRWDMARAVLKKYKVNALAGIHVIKAAKGKEIIGSFLPQYCSEERFWKFIDTLEKLCKALAKPETE